MRVLLAALAVLFGLPASAQTDYAVVGRVADAATGAPIPSASASLWRVSARAGVEPYLETGAISDGDGAFRIEGITRGRYYLVVSFVGYESARVDSLRLSPDSPVADLGTIRLLEDAEVLDDVEVTAQGDRVRVEVDRTTYQIADDPILSGGSTSDALETIPSVEVDVDGNVSLRGVSNVVILIDGRPAPVGRDFVGVYLQSLPAEAVERIEVVPNPSAAYQPDGSGGILNIVLRDDKEIGVGGAVTAGGDSQGGYSASGLLGYGRGAARLSATAAYRENVRDAENDRFRINRFIQGAPAEVARAVPLELDQASFDVRTRRSALASVSADVALSPRTTLNASASGSLRGGSSTDRTEYLGTFRDGAGLDEYTRVATGDGGGVNGSFRLGLRHDFEGVSQDGEGGESRGRRGGRGGRGGRGRGGRGGSRVALGTHALSVDLRLRASTEDDDEVLTQTASATRPATERRETSDETDRSLTLQADYARPVGQTRLEIGYRGDFDAGTDDLESESLDPATGQFRPGVGISNAYELDEQVHAAYVQLARQVGPLAVQAGVRAEAASRTFVLGGEGFSQDYQSLFPSASAALDVLEATVLRASYSRRIDRPRGRQLNPFPSTDDPLNVRVGNPDLRPEYTDALEIGVVRQTAWGSVTATPFLRRTTDVVRRFQSVDALGVTTSTFRNLDTATSTGLEAVIAYQAGGALRGFLSLEGFRQSTDGESVEAGLSSDAFGWGGRLNLNYSVGDRFGWGDLDVQTTARYRAPQNTEQGRTSARASFDLALRQRLLDGRASLALRARDPLGMGGFGFVQDDEVLYQTFSRSPRRQEVGLTFTYTFGRTEDRPDRQRPAADAGGDEGGGLDY